MMNHLGNVYSCYICRYTPVSKQVIGKQSVKVYGPLVLIVSSNKLRQLILTGHTQNCPHTRLVLARVTANL